MKQLIDFSAEIRCDFLVTVARKKQWNIELNIYQEFAAICDRHGLDYFLIYGGHLGAIRHHGFIPWDDDLDVAMLRGDFEKFLTIATEELPPEFSIVYGIVGREQFPLLRIRYLDSTGILRKDLDGKHNSGVFIEVYVLDDVPDDQQARQAQINRVENLQYLANVKLQRRFSFSKEGISTFFRLLPDSAKGLWDKSQAACAKYQTDGENGYVTCVQLPHYARLGELYLKKTVALDIIDVPFETITVKIMRDPVSLVQSYSDYMTLPPLEKRGTSHARVVFYDPDRPYTEYLGRQVVRDYFDGIGEEPFR